MGDEADALGVGDGADALGAGDEADAPGAGDEADALGVGDGADALGAGEGAEVMGGAAFKGAACTRIPKTRAVAKTAAHCSMTRGLYTFWGAGG